MEFFPAVKPVAERLESSPEQVDSVLIRKGKRGADIARITDLCKKHKIRFTFVQDQSLDKLFSGNHQGVVAKIFEAGFKSEDEVLEEALNAKLPLVVVLDQIQDPGNAGNPCQNNLRHRCWRHDHS